MITRTITKDLIITGEVYSNSKAWGHEVRAIYKGNEIAKNRIRYHNRTWEGYQFASAWLGLMSKLDSEEVVPFLDRLAMARNIKVGCGWSI